MNSIKYTATLSSSSKNTDTYNSITNSTPDRNNTLIANLSSINYPSGQVPQKDSNGYLLPNATNQAIFKNQPLSWWITNLNSGNIKYRPISNTVNWVYINSKSEEIYILFQITAIIIPNRINTRVVDPQTKITTVTYIDNNHLNLVAIHSLDAPLNTLV
jgi:hypothetical protein